MILAERFSKLARELLADDEVMDWEIAGNKTSGQIRRLSMDLTRSLAEMRNPWKP